MPARILAIKQKNGSEMVHERVGGNGAFHIIDVVRNAKGNMITEKHVGELILAAAEKLLKNSEFLQLDFTAHAIAIYLERPEIQKGFLALKGKHATKLKGYLKSYNKIVDKFEPSDLIEIQYEAIFLSSYQTFELTISDIFAELFSAFEHLYIKNFPKINLEISALYKADNMDAARKLIISQSLKEYFQSSNIVEVLEKGFKKFFGITLGLNISKLKNLYLLSRLRNILVHNGGVVNSIFLRELSNFSVQHQYHLGDKIVFETSNALHYVRELIDFLSILAKDLVPKIKQIEKYNDSQRL